MVAVLLCFVAFLGLDTACCLGFFSFTFFCPLPPPRLVIVNFKPPSVEICEDIFLLLLLPRDFVTFFFSCFLSDDDVDADCDAAFFVRSLERFWVFFVFSLLSAPARLGNGWYTVAGMTSVDDDDDDELSDNCTCGGGGEDANRDWWSCT